MFGGSPTHAFVVAAYGRSPYLEACLESLAAQDVGVPRSVSTSTPFAGLDDLCARHGATLRVHGPNRGIGHDWNAAYAAADTDWVTVAHQDDVYEPGYTAFVRDRARAHPDDRMIFSTYYELVDGARRPTVAMLRIKRVLLELGFVGTMLATVANTTASTVTAATARARLTALEINSVSAMTSDRAGKGTTGVLGGLATPPARGGRFCLRADLPVPARDRRALRQRRRGAALGRPRHRDLR